MMMGWLEEVSKAIIVDDESTMQTDECGRPLCGWVILFNVNCIQIECIDTYRKRVLNCLDCLFSIWRALNEHS